MPEYTLEEYIEAEACFNYHRNKPHIFIDMWLYLLMWTQEEE